MSVNRNFLTSFVLIMLLSIVFANTAYAMPENKRISGKDRYKTAVEISKVGWNQSDYAVLATGDNYPDALCAAPLAKKYDAPILLTERDRLNDDTRNQLLALNVKNALIIGGEGAISKSIESTLTSIGIKPVRIAGKDRYETSVKVAEQIGGNEIFLVTGDGFADAMSVASVAAIKNMPVILTTKDKLPQSVEFFLEKNKYQIKTYIIGGQDIISDTVYNFFPNAKRITGIDKYERNVKVLEEFSDDIDFTTICAATGSDYPDALAGSAFAAKTKSPVVLVKVDGSDYPDALAGSVFAAKANSSVVLVNIDGGGGPVVHFIQHQVVNNLILFGGYGALSNQAQFNLNKPSYELPILRADDVTLTVRQNEPFRFPPTVTALMKDGTVKQFEVTWTGRNLNPVPGLHLADAEYNAQVQVVPKTPGEYYYQSEIRNYCRKVKLKLIVLPN